MVFGERIAGRISGCGRRSAMRMPSARTSAQNDPTARVIHAQVFRSGVDWPWRANQYAQSASRPRS